MPRPARTAACLITSAALALAAVPPVSADTTLTVTVLPGALSVDAPPSLDFSALVPGQTASVLLPGITVTDARAGVLGWVAEVSIGDLTGTGHTISAEALTYAPGTAATTGTSTVAASPPVSGFPAPSVIQEATMVRGSNTAAWDATVTVNVPNDAPAGNYRAEIIHSVL